MRTLIYIFFISLISVRISSQDLGSPFIRNYTPDEYHGFYQNWCSEQDVRGVMYFGNGKGILEYDGKNWRRFFTDNKSTVLSMGKDTKGRIYVGAEGEIGYLAPDSLGLVKYWSLLEKIPENDRKFGYVWHVLTNKKAVYFVTPEKVIKISNTKTTVWNAKKSFFTAFMVDENFLIQENSQGMLTEKDDSLVLISGGEKFGDVRAVLPIGRNVLFATRNRGCFIYDFHSEPSYFKTEAEPFFKSLQLYKGIKINNNEYAFATINGGIIIMSTDGKVNQIINLQNGLLGNIVYNLYLDRDKQLWANLGNGLSRIEINSPFTFFTKNHGLTDIVQDIIRYNNQIYISSLGGIYKINNSSISEDNFNTASLERVKNFDQQIFFSDIYNDGVLFSGSGGVYFYKNNKIQENIFHDMNEFGVKASRFYKNRFIQGGTGSIYSIFYDGKQKKFDCIYKDGVEDFYYILEQDSTTIWAGTVNHGIYKFNYNSKFENTIKTHYDSLKGIPNGMTEVQLLNNKIYASTEKGLFLYDKEKDMFLKDTSIINQTGSVYLTIEDINKNIWLMHEKTIGYINANNKKFISTQFKRLKFNDLYKIFPDNNGIVWIGGTDGIIRFDSTHNIDTENKFNVIFSKIINHRDTIFHGAYLNDEDYVALSQSVNINNIFNYIDNSVIFEYACPGYFNEEYNSYNYFLEGFDDEWSGWLFQNKKEYTNLPEGDYVFRVKAKNIFEKESEELIFSFSINPPWYRTLMAYFIFILLGILFIYLIIKIQTRRLRNANIKLEAIVKERTQEIMQQKEEIEAQRDEIEAQRDRLLEYNEEIHQQKEEIEAQRDEIEIKKNKIEHQNKEITDSIKYAELIQYAVMPPVSFFNQLFSEGFIFFKPKDIVSGDFYWFMKKENIKFLAAVDCTGHGVPGGFMSMLGISFLNEIVANTDLKSTNLAADILDKLKSMVISSLHQSSFNNSISIKDGMDISLIAICQEVTSYEFQDTKNESENINTLTHKHINTFKCQWAGANNPLYIVNSQEYLVNSLDNNSSTPQHLNTPAHQLYELKGDKMPIGEYYGNDSLFTNHKFFLKENDSVYMFSDGFADQFGGDKGKKYKYSNFKNLLLNINNSAFYEQKEKLDMEFNNWIMPNNTTKYEQLDDILIIGIKI